MQNISFGNQPSYPAYPNCFDLLTTHGVVAEDVMGYITDTPSPYLQNYVAQYGGQLPSLPGQLMPDNLPALPQPAPLPKGDVYQSAIQPAQNQIPKQSDLTPKMFEKKDKMDVAKKLGAAALIAGLLIFSAVKAKGIAKSIYNKFFGTAAAATNAATTGAAQAATAVQQGAQNVVQTVTQTVVQNTAQATQTAQATVQTAANTGLLDKLKNHKALIGLTALGAAVLGVLGFVKHKPAPAQMSANDPFNTMNQQTMTTIPAEPLQGELKAEVPIGSQSIQPEQQTSTTQTEQQTVAAPSEASAAASQQPQSVASQPKPSLQEMVSQQSIA